MNGQSNGRMLYKPGFIAAMFDKTVPTIHNWADEFQGYLSSSANPTKGKHRQFTPEDMGVLRVVADMRAKDATYEDIHATLSTGQRGDMPEVADETAQLREFFLPGGDTDTKLAVQSLYTKIIQLEAVLDDRTDNLKAEIRELRGELREAHIRIGELRVGKGE